MCAADAPEKRETAVRAAAVMPVCDERNVAAEQVSTPAFSLSRPVAQVLPTSLISASDGRAYPIDPDFRTVLACLRRLDDPDRDDLDKRVYLAARFFLRHAPRDADRLFTQFVTGGQTGAADMPPLFDFEKDAGVIYASFRQQYGLDLLCETLHWTAFRELLAGLTEETPFGARVRLRGMDESLVAPESRAALRRARERVALAPRRSRKEQALVDELDRRLAAGEDPADIIERLREV